MLFEFLIFLVTLLSLPTGVLTRSPLCANPKTKGFLGLVIDEDTYDTQEGDPRAPTDSKFCIFDKNRTIDASPQKWILVDEGTSSDPGVNYPINSFGKKYLQALPDECRRYPPYSEDIPLTGPDQLEGVSPSVTFTIRAEKSGTHSLFLRWTGGDNVGAGDALYVALKDKETKKYVSGAATVKPAVEAIDGPLSNYAGCCYSITTHACPCYEKEEDAIDCSYFSKSDNTTHSLWQPRQSASEFGAICPVGAGAMTIIPAPEWYLFAGQEKGNVENFDAEPWDATCEAEGDSTADSGRDFANWDLSAGRDYDLVIFVREDGTALDAIYIAGPGGEAPNFMKRYTYGDSTICLRKKKSSSHNVKKFFIYTSFIAGSAILLFFAVTKTAVGSGMFDRIRMRRHSTAGRSSDLIFDQQNNQLDLQHPDTEVS